MGPPAYDDVMPADVIGREEGRRFFGSDPDAYDRARPGHPERVYEILVERCGLRAGTSVLEKSRAKPTARRRVDMLFLLRAANGRC